MVLTDTMHVIHARAAGLDVHKMQITAAVRLARPSTEAQVFTRQFSALPSGLNALAQRLRAYEVGAAVMEGTGIYWEAPYQALEHAGIEVLLVHAQHVKQLNNSLSFCPYRAGCRGSLSLARFSRASSSSSRAPTAGLWKVGSRRRSARNGFADSGLDAGSGHLCRHGVG